MAMTTFTNQAADTLVQSIATFLAANGWSLDASRTVGERYEAYLSISYGGTTYRFALASRDPRAYSSSLSRIDLIGMSAGYNGALTFENQTPRSCICRASVHPTDNYRCFVFCDSQYVAIIVEPATGYCRHLQFGILNTLWTPGGSTPIGQFVRGSWGEHANDGQVPNAWNLTGSSILQFWNNKVTSNSGVDGSIDVFAGQGDGNGLWLRSRGTTSNYGPFTSAERNSSILAYRRPDNIRGMLPIEVFGCHNPNQAIPHFFFGHMPGVYTLDAGGSLVNDQITIGADDYRLFPAENTLASTSTKWLAYKEV